MNIIESAGLGKRYRRSWALRDCTLEIPGGHVVALVGPNGAGKTTLLSMAVGLTTPTAGMVTVLGGERAGSPDALDRIAFVAQDAPLYGNLPAGDMLHLARNLNRRWDARRAEDRLAELGIPLEKKVGKLSGGQKAQLALTIALARARPAGPRRAARRAGPAGQARLHGVGGGGGGGGRHLRRAVLARAGRAGAGRRLPDRAGPRADAGGRRGGGPAG